VNYQLLRPKERCLHACLPAFGNITLHRFMEASQPLPIQTDNETHTSPYSVLAVANEFLNLGSRDLIPVSPMKIQKLLYMAHAYHLCKHNRPLVNEEFEVWKFGPVLPGLYHKCKHFDQTEIKGFLVYADHDFGKAEPERVPKDDVDAIESINAIWDQFGKYDPMVLSKWTHVRNGPWDQSRGKTNIIPNDLIKRYFDSRVRKNRNG